MNKSLPWGKDTKVEAIATHHNAFVSSIENLDAASFEFSWMNKWTRDNN